MSETAMTVIISTGIGVSVIAGILSGICYIVAHSLKPQNRYRRSVPGRCAACERQLPPDSALLGNTKVVRCSACLHKVCKYRCAKYDHIEQKWLCLACQASWIRSMFNNITKSALFSSHRTDIELMEEEAGKEYVRDFIERMVATLLGGSVDDASINRVYVDKQYVSLFERYHRDLCSALTDLGSALHFSITNLPALGQSPSNAHANLKQIIGKLLKETFQITDLSQVPANSAGNDDSDNPQSYEELLATAILNKIVNSNQLQNKASSSTPSSRSRARSRRRAENESFFETSSVSSFNEDLLQSDSSIGSTKYVDRVSLTIQQEIETGGSSEDDDDFEHYRPSSTLLVDDGSNWYMQKRHRFSSHSPIPVPMLVPNPTVDSKVLIGDKEVDETSDLSDTCSDFDDGTMASSSLIVEAKTVIGGKNALGKIVRLEELSDLGSSVDSGVKVDKSKTDASMDDDNVEDVSLESQHSSHVEKDTEYAEKYESLPRTIELRKVATSRSTASLPEKEKIEVGHASDSDEANSEFQGNYSKREKEKWNHPILMKNNPYTRESIEKRNKNDLFGRDYYTRLASTPDGGSTKSKRSDTSWIGHVPETPDLHKAIPVLVEEDRSEPIAPEEPSDSDLSLINCYDVENSTVLPPSEPVQLVAMKAIREGEHVRPQPKTRTFLATKVVEKAPKPPLRQQDSHLKRKLALREEAPVARMQRSSSLHDVVQSMMAEPRPEFARSKSATSLDDIGLRPTFALKKKSDNTLIRRIYADLSVRSYALAHRQAIPGDVDGVRAREEPILEPPPQFANEGRKIELLPANDSNNNRFKFGTLDSRHEDDVDIKLKQKAVEATADEVVNGPSVAELRRKFDAMSSSDNNKKPIHSLTARKKRVFQSVVNSN